MQLIELQKQLETDDKSFHGSCHDCGVPVNVLCTVNENGELVISGGAVYNPLNNEQYFFKCDECFQKDSVLRNWRQIEVYSRVVGYIRPINSWNKGKQEEWEMRVDYKIWGDERQEGEMQRNMLRQ